MQWYITHTIRYIALIEDSTDEEVLQYPHLLNYESVIILRSSIKHCLKQYDMEHEQQFQPPSAYRASPPYHDPQRSASDHVNYQHSCLNSRFEQHIPPTSIYPQVETSYFAFPPSTPFSGGPSSFSGGPSNYFGTSTMTPPSSYHHASSSQNVYRPTLDFQYLQQSNESHPSDEDQHMQSPTLQQQQQRRGQRQRRRPTCGIGGHR
ncbi:hypothetical protein VIGAN_02212500 [Vigna angularis var. angularis]|uniref:Uncharacterized protein n=1 Tax=Vigna angularis var. angularis TaxID=157739 RepID=A0A0S3RFD1_PHAAN|nr:hypothetical protein VIGAN_02212500 [Vigna angularis var. angularis]